VPVLKGADTRLHLEWHVKMNVVVGSGAIYRRPLTPDFLDTRSILGPEDCADP
jgi:hypothetical protein